MEKYTPIKDLPEGKPKAVFQDNRSGELDSTLKQYICAEKYSSPWFSGVGVHDGRSFPPTCPSWSGIQTIWELQAASQYTQLKICQL